MPLTAQELASRIGCELRGDGGLELHDVAPLDRAGPHETSFLGGDKELSRLKDSRAGAVIVPRKLAEGLPGDRTWLIADDAQRAFIAAMLLFRPAAPRPQLGVSPSAFVSRTAELGPDCNVFPGAFIGDGARLGAGCDIYPGAVVGPGCRLGDGVVVHPHAVLYSGVIVGARVIIHAGAVLGADGFGYRFEQGRYIRIPHTGTVFVEDDVEIGACTTIDRAMVGATRIGAGTKLDNLVMIGHNCELGRHNAFASQVGLAGSVTTGDYVRCAGQVGVADHLHLGAKSTLAAKAGLLADVPDGAHVIGAPAVPVREGFRQFAAVQRLPDVLKDLKVLAERVQLLEQQLAQQASAPSPGALSAHQGVNPAATARAA